MTTLDLGSSIADPLAVPSREHVEDLHRMLLDAAANVDTAAGVRSDAALGIADLLALGGEVDNDHLDLYRQLRATELEARAARRRISIALIDAIGRAQ